MYIHICVPVFHIPVCVCCQTHKKHSVLPELEDTVQDHKMDRINVLWCVFDVG